MLQITNDDIIDGDLLDERATCKYLGGQTKPINRSMLRKGVAEGRYPKPITIGVRKKRWLVPELRAVRAQQIAARKQQVEAS